MRITPDQAQGAKSHRESLSTDAPSFAKRASPRRAASSRGDRRLGHWILASISVYALQAAVMRM
jgi:hypothetical protein